MIEIIPGRHPCKTEPGGGNCANRWIFSRCCRGKALKRSGGSNFAIEIAPAVAVATTTAAFAATVASHGQESPPAQPSQAPRQVAHTA